VLFVNPGKRELVVPDADGTGQEPLQKVELRPAIGRKTVLHKNETQVRPVPRVTETGIQVPAENGLNRGFIPQ
jgi:hypothetical protein